MLYVNYREGVKAALFTFDLEPKERDAGVEGPVGNAIFGRAVRP